MQHKFWNYLSEFIYHIETNSALKGRLPIQLAPMPYNFFFAEQTFFAQICVLSQSNLNIFLFENIFSSFMAPGPDLLTRYLFLYDIWTLTNNFRICVALFNFFPLGYIICHVNFLNRHSENVLTYYSPFEFYKSTKFFS
jgi:hypothetical protein